MTKQEFSDFLQDLADQLERKPLSIGKDVARTNMGKKTDNSEEITIKLGRSAALKANITNAQQTIHTTEPATFQSTASALQYEFGKLDWTPIKTIGEVD